MEKVIKDLENYSIDEQGIVRNVAKGTVKSARPNKQTGYFQVDLWKNNVSHKKYIHRLIAEAFIPNPLNLPEVNHIDGNRQNNDISNLEWVDSRGNKIHAVKTGLRKYKNRLTEGQFIQLLNRVINGESYQSISETINYKVPFLSVKLRAIAKKFGREEALNNALKEQRLKRALKNIEKANSK